MWRLFGATAAFFVLGIYAGLVLPISQEVSAVQGETTHNYPYLNAISYTQPPTPQAAPVVTAAVIESQNTLDARFAGMLLHVRWLLEKRGGTVVEAELKRLDKQILSLMDDVSDDISDLRDDIDDAGGLPSGFVVDNTGTITTGIWQGTQILDAYIADVLTIGAGSTLANNIVTPTNLLATGQIDEYCLTYEATGTTWEWQTCGGGGGSSFATTSIDTSLKLANIVTDETGTGALVFAGSPTLTGTLTAANANFSGNVGIGTTTPNQKLTVQGNINLSAATGAIYFDDVKYLYASSTNGSVTFGENAGSLFTSGMYRNVAIGYNAGQYASTSDVADSIFLGSWAGGESQGADNFFAGNSAGYLNIGSSNVALGFAAGTSNTGNDNNIFGYNSGSDNSGDFNNIFGASAGRNNSGDYNNILGDGAGYGNSGSGSNFFGRNAGHNNSGANNNFLSAYSGYNNVGVHNNLFGYNAGYNNNGSTNLIIGPDAGYNNIGSNNIIFGDDAGYNNSGNENFLAGSFAGYNSDGDYNFFTGYNAGRYIQGDANIALGAEALLGSHATNYFSSNNIALGYRAGYASDDGSGNNILIGYRAADNLTTGNNNIIIGYDIDNITAAADNRLNIGNLIFGTGLDGTGTTLSSGNVGIGSTSPSAKLTIQNTGSGNSFIVEDQANDTTPFVIDASGKVGVGTVSPRADTAFNVESSMSDTLGFRNGITSHVNSTALADSTANLNGGNFYAESVWNSPYNVGRLTGLYGGAYHEGIGVATTLNGLWAETGNYNTGTVTNNSTLIVTADNEGLITNQKYISVESSGNTGTITNTYGLYLGDLTAGTQTNQAYSVYASDANTRNYFAGNVGIGTTSPYAKLSVDGNSAFTGQLNLSGTGANIALGSNWLSGDGGDEGVYVSSDGRVGVGTTAVTSANLTIRKDYDGYTQMYISNQDFGQYTASSLWLSGGPESDARVTAFSRFGNPGGISLPGSVEISSGSMMSNGIQLLTKNADAPITFFTANTEKMRLTSVGNFGIGSTSPASKLTVSGTAFSNQPVAYYDEAYATMYAQESHMLTVSGLDGAAFTKTFANTYNRMNVDGAGAGASISNAVFDMNVTGSGASDGNSFGGTDTTVTYTGGNSTNSSFTGLSVGAYNASGYNVNNLNGISAGAQNTLDGSAVSVAQYGIAVGTGNSCANCSVNESIAYRATPFNNGNNSTITNMMGFGGYLLNSGTGAVVTNAYGAYVGAFNGATFTNTYGFYVGDITSGTQTNTPYSFYASDAGTRNYFAGNVGIGTTTPAQKLQVFGNVRVGTTGSNGCIEDYGGGVIGGTCSSDEQLKENIESLASSTPRSYLEALTSLTPVTYTWNLEASERYGKSMNVANLGLIAQDVEDVFPELVSKNEDNFRQVDFRALPFYIIEAVKELWTKVRGIDERVEDLEQENEYLKSRLEAIEDELNVAPPPPPMPEIESVTDTVLGPEPLLPTEEILVSELEPVSEPVLVQEPEVSVELITEPGI